MYVAVTSKPVRKSRQSPNPYSVDFICRVIWGILWNSKVKSKAQKSIKLLDGEGVRQFKKKKKRILTFSVLHTLKQKEPKNVSLKPKEKESPEEHVEVGGGLWESSL